MAKKVQCPTHGEAEATFVCHHLSGDDCGLGFHTEKPTKRRPFPDAWCDRCEVVRQAEGGWNDVSEGHAEVSLLCSGCYQRSRIRNTLPAITLNDLAGLRWKCGNCDEWHMGPALDFGFSAPYYWSKNLDKSSRWSDSTSDGNRKRSKTFLDSEYCAINDEDFFVRGIIHIPILGTCECLCWGVWGSLSRANFELLLSTEGTPEQSELSPMFSWLSTRLGDYPETLGLKMSARIQPLGSRPHFELEKCDHPLSVDFSNGITPERLKEIMFRMLPAQPQ